MAYTTINKSSEYFNTKLYTGTGATNAITGVGFQPDLIWSKNRGAVSNHFLVDVIRGTEEELRTNSTNHSAGDGALMDSIDSDGFTLSTSASMNTSSANYVAWNWLAGNGTSSNTDGSITSTVSANTTSGMSIIQYSGNGSAGATIGHGLGVAPKCVIIKRTDTTSNWIFGTGARGFDKFLYLNLTDAETDNAGTFNDTAPSSSVITLGSWNDVNNASGTYIAYVFAEKKGFSKFGSYTGNGNADGPMIFTGFKPAMVIYKRSDGVEGWMIQDNRRPGYNPMGGNLFPNNTNAESTDARFDFLSNGFKARSGNQNTNASTHIYMAFAEEPLVGTNNIPATAR
jgi:hypothetical protein